jgi:hypothetical protein
VKTSRVSEIGRVLLAALLASSKAAFAQTIAVSGSPAILHITTAIAGSAPVAITNSSTTYTVVIPQGHVSPTFKVTAQLDAAMPAGTTLTATLAAPAAGGTSTGAVALDITPRDMVTGIPKKINSTQGITYTFSATPAAGVVPVSTRTMTLTVLAFP